MNPRLRNVPGRLAWLPKRAPQFLRAHDASHSVLLANLSGLVVKSASGSCRAGFKSRELRPVGCTQSRYGDRVHVSDRANIRIRSRSSSPWITVDNTLRHPNRAPAPIDIASVLRRARARRGSHPAEQRELRHRGTLVPTRNRTPVPAGAPELRGRGGRHGGRVRLGKSERPAAFFFWQSRASTADVRPERIHRRTRVHSQLRPTAPLATLWRDQPIASHPADCRSGPEPANRLRLHGDEPGSLT